MSSQNKISNTVGIIGILTLNQQLLPFTVDIKLFSIKFFTVKTNSEGVSMWILFMMFVVFMVRGALGCMRDESNIWITVSRNLPYFSHLFPEPAKRQSGTARCVEQKRSESNKEPPEQFHLVYSGNFAGLSKIVKKKLTCLEQQKMAKTANQLTNSQTAF